MRTSVSLAIGLLAISSLMGRASGDDDLDFFERKIRPVLVTHCYECHSATAKEIQGELVLDTQDGTHQGGSTGPAVVPGDLDASLLIEAIRYGEDAYQMPPKGKLPQNVIADFETWIRNGAVDPRQAASDLVSKPSSAPAAAEELWSLQPLKTPAVPSVKTTDWPRGDVDQFLLAKMEAVGIAPIADASPRTLVRRLFFDLLGLPPSAEELDNWSERLESASNDQRPAYAEGLAELVDQLLASPHFGERWGRHWMDVVRYADSSGGGANVVFDHAWQYRDYIIRAYNDDKPFNRFVQEQIAGDLLSSANEKEKRDALIATTFLAIGPMELAEYDLPKLQLDVVDDQIDTIGKALLGLTLGCARCHDHKFDPVPTRDYYALAGIFRSTLTLENKRKGVIVQSYLRELPGDKAKALGVAEGAKPADSPVFVRGESHAGGG